MHILPIEAEERAWRVVFPVLCLAISWGAFRSPSNGGLFLYISSGFWGTLWTGYLLFGGRRFARLLRSDGSPIRSRIASSRFLICAALIGALPACAYRHLHLPWPLALQPGEVAFVAFESAVFLMLGHLLLAYTFFREYRGTSRPEVRRLP